MHPGVREQPAPVRLVVKELIEGPKPRQIEFARLNLTYTILSKRRLIELVEGRLVSGWDDPRMPTVAGMRRRGYTPRAIREFCSRIGVAKKDNLVDIALLEHCVREDLNETVPRAMAVLKPLKVIIDNYPEGQVEEMECSNHPQKPEMGTRKVPFSRVLYIESDDFMENPPKKYKRLGPGRGVRLRNSYVIRFVSLIRDEATGEISELHCTYDPETKNAPPPDGRKVEGLASGFGRTRYRQRSVSMTDFSGSPTPPAPRASSRTFSTRGRSRSLPPGSNRASRRLHLKAGFSSRGSAISVST